MDGVPPSPLHPEASNIRKEGCTPRHEYSYGAPSFPVRRRLPSAPIARRGIFRSSTDRPPRVRVRWSPHPPTAVEDLPLESLHRPLRARCTRPFFRGAMAGPATHRPFRRAPSSRLHLRDALAFEPHRISRGRLGGHETSERRTWWTWWTRRTRRTSPRWRLWTWWRCEAAAGWEEQTAMAEGRADDGKRDG